CLSDRHRWLGHRSCKTCLRLSLVLWRRNELWSGLFLLFLCVPSMALILLVKVQSRVFTAKCSEPQVSTSNGMDEGSGVAKFLSLRTET
ncbi:MAG: hypothetical protein IKL07_10210, partial [Clostridium sp.]|nr:hypothetical protein [Clostridium sp.]